MKRRREILQDAINLLLFLAGILLTFTLLALLDPAIKRAVTSLIPLH
jgi:hypothetical protein